MTTWLTEASSDVPTPDRGFGHLFQRDRVHGSAYREAAVFDAEMRRIFEDTWVFVAHESEIPEPGDFKSTRLGRQPVVVVRQPGGEVRVLLNRCRHRAATVCDERYGNRRYFRCPYHFWTYDTAGRLVSYPNKERYEVQLDPVEDGLGAVARVDVFAGFVFAKLTPGGPSLEEHLAGAAPYLEQVARGGLDIRSGGVTRYQFAANWKIQQENVVDYSHGVLLHEFYFEQVARRLRAAGKEVPRRDEATSDWKAIDLGNGHSCIDYGRSGLPDLDIVANLPFNLQVFPNLGFVSVQMRVIYPLSATSTLVDGFATVLGDASDEVNRARLRMHEDSYGPAGLITPDDLDVVMRRVPEGLAADGGEDWVRFDMGSGLEQPGPPGESWGDVRDEVPQRAIYRQWAKLLA